MEQAAARGVGGSVYAPPRLVTDPADCYFYHTVEAPGYGTLRGDWDLRGFVDDYLGRVDLRGKRVLELGTASGFLCTEMEKRGAEVIAHDVDEYHDRDAVPFGPAVPRHRADAMRGVIRRLNNGWWLVHRACRSSARVVYGSIYDIPDAIGPVDVATFGCILLHLRDPFRALESAARFAREAVVVTEVDTFTDRFPDDPDGHPPAPTGLRGRFLNLAHRLLGDRRWREREDRLRARAERFRSVLDAPAALFLPTHTDPTQDHAWWSFRPRAVCAMLGVLGFPHATVTATDGPLYQGRPQRMFTVVARR